jgi:hypothetical protein
MRASLSLLALSTLALLAAYASDAGAAPPWVERTLTLPGGDWAFDVGLGVAHIPPPPPGSPVHEVTGGVNMEVAVGVTDRVELGLRSALRFGEAPDRGVEADRYGRLFDRQTFDTGAGVIANPEFRVTGTIVRESIVELALEGRVVLPFEAGTGAGFLFGVPASFHFGSMFRLDVGAYTPVILFDHNQHFSTEVDLRLPANFWIQATDRLWLGPMAGIEFVQPQYANDPNVFVGFGLGYQIAHALDFKTMLLAYQNGDFGIGAGIQVRVE